MSLQTHKCNPELGMAIEAYLQEKGVNTPTIKEKIDVKDEVKIKKIEKHMQAILEILGLDLSDDSLIETPMRVAKMYVKETMWGLRPEYFPKCTAVENKMGYDEMVVEKNITVMSECEHHIKQIDGKCHIAYIPKNKVLGLSKLNRIVEYFSRRPQIQERLAEQIYHSLVYILGTEDVAVVIDAKHYCVISRGVSDSSSSTITSKLGGCFRNESEARAEFLSVVKQSRL